MKKKYYSISDEEILANNAYADLGKIENDIEHTDVYKKCANVLEITSDFLDARLYELEDILTGSDHLEISFNELKVLFRCYDQIKDLVSFLKCRGFGLPF